MSEWNTGLAHRYVALTLSQYIVGVEMELMSSSLSRFVTQLSSVAVVVIARSSASVVDRATVLCNCLLLLRTPTNWINSKKDNIPQCGYSAIKVPCPISINKGMEMKGGVFTKKETMIEGP